MNQLKNWIGVELDEVSAKEKLISAAGGVVAILLIVLVSRDALHHVGASMLIASMGASAVLLFAVPHGQLSQPWPVVGGHFFSAFIGVTCARFIPHVPLAAACAVGGAIWVMHQLKCIHPPGGATALTAVVGGPGVAALGYSFVWTPVLQNALLIVATAVVFNCAFRWRRYPAAFNKRRKPVEGQREVSHESVVAALKSLDSFVDITEDDLVRVYHIILEHQKRDALLPAKGRTD